jgi:hypothetical protein
VRFPHNSWMEIGKRLGQRGICFALGTALVVAAGTQITINAQNRAYGPGHTWWQPGQRDVLPWAEQYENSTGALTIFNKTGAVNAEGHPFFEALGKNGRACVTCHQPSNAMSLTAELARSRWTDTGGKDPLFAAIDGANCPDLPQSDANSHSLLLSRGLIRIAMPWPPRTSDGSRIHPDFQLEVVNDPTGCNVSPRFGLHSDQPSISVFRRPRMTANLPLLVSGSSGIALMADGREPTLRAQAITAALVHEEASAPPDEDKLRRILAFETQVFTAQGSDIRGGLLNEMGGPVSLGAENLADGKATPLGLEYRDQVLLSLRPWSSIDSAHQGLQYQFRASVARGSSLFFKRTFRVNGHSATSTEVTCATCHSSGSKRWANVGNTDAERSPSSLPVFKITCSATAPPPPGLSRVIFTHDPGRALVTGKCEDVGAIVVPQFRALSARAPYFEGGSAATLPDVIEFYSRQFHADFSPDERRDLVNFLSVL